MNKFKLLVVIISIALYLVACHGDNCHSELHIPAAVFHHLKDQVPNGNETGTNDINPFTCCFLVDDRVQNFTSGQMFSLLSSSTKSPNQFFIKLMQQFGNNDPILLAKMQSLFDSY